jgi:hypothetical protein
VNRNKNPNAQSIGVLNSIEPPHIVAIHENTLTPVGTAITMVAIGIVGFVVWAHHMYTVGLSTDTKAYFLAATMIIAVPTPILVFWTSRSLHINSSWFWNDKSYCFNFF